MCELGERPRTKRTKASTRSKFLHHFSCSLLHAAQRSPPRTGFSFSSCVPLRALSRNSDPQRPPPPTTPWHPLYLSASEALGHLFRTCVFVLAANPDEDHAVGTFAACAPPASLTTLTPRELSDELDIGGFVPLTHTSLCACCVCGYRAYNCPNSLLGTPYQQAPPRGGFTRGLSSSPMRARAYVCRIEPTQGPIHVPPSHKSGISITGRRPRDLNLPATTLKSAIGGTDR